MSSLDHKDSGLRYWRSLEELADSPDVRTLLEREFPGYDPQAIASMSRRRFMKLMGASMALAGLTLSGCRRWPEEKIAPFASRPRERIPGVPEQYATVMDLGGVAQPLLVTTYDGRPIKVEGNPDHPWSKTGPNYGSADAFAQASVLELYDPERSRAPVDRRAGAPVGDGWQGWRAFSASHFAAIRESKGAGLAVLSEANSSPSVERLRARLKDICPQATWFEYEPISRDNERLGLKAAFGHAVRPILHLDKADVVVSLDDDFLFTHPAHTRYAADWSTRRRDASMNCVLIAESCYSITGSVADHRLAIAASRIEFIARAIGAKVGLSNMDGGTLTPEELQFAETATAQLMGHKGKARVTAGAHLPPSAHTLVQAINAKIGARVATVTFVEASDADRPTHADAIAALAGDLKAGKVKTLLILGGNPAYDAPADLDFAKAIASAAISIHLSVYENETSKACGIHVPRAHYLESWGDGRAWDGTVSVGQPMIEPLFGGVSAIELLSQLCGESRAGDEIVRRTLTQWLPKEDAEKAWRKVLHDGLLEGSGFKAVDAEFKGEMPRPSSAATAAGYELRFEIDQSIYDGRFANNGWLQETPRSLTKLVWDNAALISKADADKEGIVTGDVIELSVDNRSLEIAAYILPGQPQGVIGLPLGYGRTVAGHIGNGLGFNTYALRTRAGQVYNLGAKLRKTGRRYDLVMTQDHQLIDSIGAKARDERIGTKGKSGPIIREATADEYKADPRFARRDENGKTTLQLFQAPMKFDDPHAWGMAIDMSACIGCNACVVACQAENNVPVVGKDMVAMHRQMHWIRIDRYFKGEVQAPDVAYQPMMCVHCENAPCEQVCPVAATVHDSEGLNTMVYNRCVGTRYCSNNCPYKVRVFNYFDFHSKDPRGMAKPWLGLPDSQQRAEVDPIKRMVYNPEVTVRMRGVMEKCTYCVQRIHTVQTAKRNAGEEPRDGDIISACQQSCPTQAIIFGDLKDPKSRVSKLHANDRAYGVLADLNTRPRTMHLAKLRNPPKDKERHG